MGDTLLNLQPITRFFALDSDLVITSGEGLAVSNLVYQGMLTPDYRLAGVLNVGRRWPEVTREDTSITTTVGVEQYSWLTGVVFKDEPYIELVDASDNEPWPIDPVPSMGVWSRADMTTNGTPRYYRMIDVSGRGVQIALRPKPDTTGDTIRVTGIIEAPEFEDGSSRTVFRHKNSDRALALFIAYHYLRQRRKFDDANSVATEGLSLLPTYDFTPRIRPSAGSRPYCT